MRTIAMAFNEVYLLLSPHHVYLRSARNVRTREFDRALDATGLRVRMCLEQHLVFGAHGN